MPHQRIDPFDRPLYDFPMSTLEIIIQDLKTLPPPKLQEAANFIHRLREMSPEDRLALLK